MTTADATAHREEKPIVKCDEDTNPEFGCPPSDRPILEYLGHGLVVIDKPQGPTSHQVSSWVRTIFSFSKAGHSGTLDPKVTGVLPVALENATKVLDVLLLSGKEYVGALELHADVDAKRLWNAMSYFTGSIYQRPPLKSAVKRELRVRRVYALEPMECEGRRILFRVSCESGTYIRKLCHDLGLYLGCGGSMHDLRRVRAGPFSENDMVTLHDLRDAWEFYREDGEEKGLRACVRPQEEAVRELGKIWLKDSAVDAVCHGAPLAAPGITRLTPGINAGDLVALMSLKDELVATARSALSTEAMLAAKKGEAARLLRVFMEPGVYPRQWGGK